MTSTPDTLSRSTDSSQPLVPLLEERWSPRSYDDTATMTDAQLDAVLEAARWAASAMNHQPRRFVAGRRGTDTFAKINDNLLGFNAAWAFRASALVVGILETTTEDGDERPFAQYDLGQSLTALTVQAHAEGLHVHQMAGIDAEGLRAAFDLPERFLPYTVTAIGTVADPSQLDEKAAEREVAPRTRLPLDEVVLVKE
ncbi:MULTISPECIES: nitroreductase family protein [unclassified Curtobacterium]|jgi:nitroreductase|uniref:nitroreductase family protein n=1 Tax=unclassified Curtobacterium TaxID=257496 RepID=UPI00052AD3C9|nr:MULTISPECIES: nitroreductase family protein [unclassified Curtobacterium]AIV39396.1 nitroreductase [Curtobacterium sp. MR_MD2014]MBP1301352.1 nitroreductase [Curtobacterium sp. 1310]MCM3503524.1 nitroreductase family protein [Curtobacterium sp. ODYSSEY 48 V2]MCM3522008.1 nitroreductase family protein [Curtobacterium sp. P97]MDB6428494.1 nitroreductase family protein [Curtobacterium sp. 20TX0008]